MPEAKLPLALGALWCTTYHEGKELDFGLVSNIHIDTGKMWIVEGKGLSSSHGCIITLANSYSLCSIVQILEADLL